MLVRERNLLVFLYFLSFLLAFTTGKRVKGTLQSVHDWKFLARFCFKTGGHLGYNLAYPKSRCCQNILMYFDEAFQWDAAYDSNLNCTQRVALLNPRNNQKIVLDPAEDFSGCTDEFSTDTLQCTRSRRFVSALDRWWYLAVSRCGSTNGLYLEYDLHFLNPGGFWKREFSADEQGILETDIGFGIAMFLLMWVSFIWGSLLSQREMLHTTYKLYLVSIVLQVFGLSFLCIHYGVYGENGMGVDTLKTIGRVLSAVSELMFLVMLLLLAKGWTVVRGRLTNTSQFRLTALMTLYTVVYAAMFIWEAVAFDPGKVIYIYDSPAGYGLVALSFVSFCWFTFAVITTMKNHPNKRAFYLPFYFLFSLWFLARPVVVLVANHHLLDYAREKVVNGVNLAIVFCGYVFHLILTRPSAANTNFPFHIRTTQVDIAQEDENDLSHPYAPTQFIGVASPNSHELFSASRSSQETPQGSTERAFEVRKGRSRERGNGSQSNGRSSHGQHVPMRLFSGRPPTPPPSYEESVS